MASEGATVRTSAATIRSTLDTRGLCLWLTCVLTVSADLGPNVLSKAAPGLTLPEAAPAHFDGCEGRLPRVEGLPLALEVEQCNR